MESYLKQKRLESGITLEDASKHLKIRVQYLIALEENNLSSLPAEVYIKGYLKLYSDYLGIPDEARPVLDEETNTKLDILIQDKKCFSIINNKCKKKVYLILTSCIMLVVVTLIYHFIF